MKQTYIDFIEKTVRAKCPELQELSMGCRVLCMTKDNHVFDDVITNDYKHTMEMARMKYLDECYGDTWYVQRGYLQKPDRVRGRRLENNDLFELAGIIGHPIHLEHILRTMGYEWAMTFCPTGYILLKQAENGSYYKFWNGDDNGGDFIVFSRLSWKDQEESTLKFIAENMGFNQ